MSGRPGTWTFIGIPVLLVVFAFIMWVTGWNPVSGGLSAFVGLSLLIVAAFLLAIGSKLNRGVWACVGPAVKWWSLENIAILGQGMFGVAGVIATLAAVDFFYFAPQIPTPIVASLTYIDVHSLPTVTASAEIDAITHSIAALLTPADLRERTHVYDSAQVLVHDCEALSSTIDEFAPGACESLSLTMIPYPEYLHDLVMRASNLDPLEFAAARAMLTDAAVSVDAVTVTNEGGVAASDVEMSVPAGLQPVDASADAVPFTIPARNSAILLFRAAPSSSTTANALPLDGFLVTSSTGDTVIDQKLALHLLEGSLVFFVIIVIADMWRTRRHSGKRPVGTDG